jgi:recombination protein RecA
VIGNRTRVKVVKNKVAPPFKEVEFDILYGEGISREGDMLDLAAEKNIIEKSGTWYNYGTERIGQGRENARQWLKEHPETMEKIRKIVLEKANIGKNSAALAAPVATDKEAGKEALSQATKQAATKESSKSSLPKSKH